MMSIDAGYIPANEHPHRVPDLIDEVINHAAQPVILKTGGTAVRYACREQDCGELVEYKLSLGGAGFLAGALDVTKRPIIDLRTDPHGELNSTN